jgi:hypothetical protein
MALHWQSGALTEGLDLVNTKDLPLIILPAATWLSFSHLRALRILWTWQVCFAQSHIFSPPPTDLTTAPNQLSPLCFPLPFVCVCVCVSARARVCVSYHYFSFGMSRRKLRPQVR